MRTRVIPVVFVVLLAFLSEACDIIPTFDRKPIISFKEIKSFRSATGGDSVVVTITFRDGDGDLGLDPFDTVPPFNSFNLVNGVRQPNELRNNYHIAILKRIGRDDAGRPNYEPVEFPTPGFNFNSRFPRLNVDGKSGPIEGDLDYSIPIEFPPSRVNPKYILPGDTLVFDIFVYDRDEVGGYRNPNKSNQIRTGEVIVLRR